MIGCRDRGCWCSWYDWLSISTTNRMTNALRHERPATASQGVRVFQFLGFIPIGWKIKFSSSHWSEFFFDQWDVLNFIFQPMGVLCKNWAKAQFLQSELEPIHGSSSLISTFLLFNILSKHVIVTITCFDITSGWGSEPHPESSMKLSGGGINPLRWGCFARPRNSFPRASFPSEYLLNPYEQVFRRKYGARNWVPSPIGSSEGCLRILRNFPL